MSKKDAEVVVGGDASDVEKAFSKAADAARKARADMVGEMASAAKSVVGSFTEIATSQGKINFAAQHEQVKQFENATAHLATAAGSDLQSMRNEIIATGKEIGMQPSKVAQWTSEVGKLTYNFRGAAEGIKGISQLASMTGRSVDEYKGFATVLSTVGQVSGDTTDVIGKLIAQADALGTIGGPAAFIDQITAMSGALSQVTVTQENFLRVTAGMGALTAGLSPAAAGRVQQGAINTLTSDPRKWERYLHKHILDDETGKIGTKDYTPDQILKDITSKVRKEWGGGNANSEEYRNIMIKTFGAEQGLAMMRAEKTGAGAAEALAGIAPSGKAGAAEKAMLGTDAGKRDVAEATLFESSNKLMGSSTMLGQAADKLKEFAANNPFMSTMMMNVGGAGAENIMGRFGKYGKGAIEGGSKGAIEMNAAALGKVGGAAGLASKALAGVGVAGMAVQSFMIGWAAGKWLDEKTGFSDKFGIKGIAEKDFKDTRGALDARVANLQLAGKGVRAAGIKGGDLKAAYDATNAAVNAGNAPGTAGMSKAIYDGLVKSGKSEKDAALLSKAITDGMAKVKIEVKNDTGNPITAATAAADGPAGGGS